MSKVLSVLIAGIFATTAGIAAAQDKKAEPTKAAPAASTTAPKADATKADATKAAADAKKDAKSVKGTEKKDKK